MAIFHTSIVLILVSIILISISPSSIAHKLTDTEIKHLCSKTRNPEGCYTILKSDHRTANIDAKGLAQVSLDLASERARKIQAQLNAFAKATHDSRLRNVYESCSKKYDDIVHDLEAAKKNLRSKHVPIRVKDASEENKSCEKVLDGASTSDRTYLQKKIQDVKFMLTIVKVMWDNLNKK
ncbi:hypothetical protein DH2020_005032 [Rehmannia glutinosa]|uniref:Pectinesterase inhibitor domain-containing protein n=1 Tax=Rehmannia glutinosa TaxID=99300 RepID=A0ABR0XR55_REHGL